MILVSIMVTAGFANELPPTVRRHALVIGSNAGSRELEDLRFAEDDASRFSEVLMELGRFSGEDITVLRGPDRASIEGALDHHRTLAAEGNDLFVFYYSGHADLQGLRLGVDHYPFETLKHDVRQLEADVSLGILDACRSGEITRIKGFNLSDPFQAEDDFEVEGEAWLTATTADEAAQESDRIRGSFFTHYLVSALRGAADQGDGVVSLGEAYAYAYDRTVVRTGGTAAGTQHPTYDFRLQGRGDLPLTTVTEGTASLLLDEEMAGLLIVERMPDRTPVAEVAKIEEVALQLALPPGRYALTLRGEDTSHEAQIGLSEGAHLIVPDFGERDLELATAKGHSDVPETHWQSWRRQAEEAAFQIEKLVNEDLPILGDQITLSVTAPPAPAGPHYLWMGSLGPVFDCAERSRGCLTGVLDDVIIPDGPIRGVGQTGQVAFQGAVLHNRPVGFWTFHFPDGETQCQGAYIAGNKAGTWTCQYQELRCRTRRMQCKKR